MSKAPGEIRLDRLEENELMRKIAARDEAAFAEFENKYRNLIFSTAYKVIAHRQDCEDITNEVLLTVWKKADQFNKKRGSLVTWICTTARNRAIDKLRSIKRKSKLHDDFQQTEKVSGDIVECGFDPILRSDTRTFLENQIESLPLHQQEVIRLIYFEGLTQKQVADRLGRPLGTVKAQMTRGLRRIRSQMSCMQTLN